MCLAVNKASDLLQPPQSFQGGMFPPIYTPLPVGPKSPKALKTQSVL